MSKENPPQDWNQMWIEYNKSLQNWRDAFESLHRATNDLQCKYHEAMANMLKNSNDHTMSQFMENWQKSMGKAGIGLLKQDADADHSIIDKKEPIKTSGQPINDLIKLGNKFGANTNILEDARKILNDPNPNNGKTAYGKLGMFINQVNQNHHLTSSQKAQLIDAANAIKTSI